MTKSCSIASSSHSVKFSYIFKEPSKILAPSDESATPCFVADEKVEPKRPRQFASPYQRNRPLQAYPMDRGVYRQCRSLGVEVSRCYGYPEQFYGQTHTNWAVANHCEIISMSLGRVVQVGETFSAIYEQVAQRALNAGTLIIAAAGNNSQRPGLISPVNEPANSPSIMAIGALDSGLKISFFSCGGRNPQGGQVDIAAPGLNVRSSWPRPMLYNTISGTSMATPHVAGIAALHAEANPNARGRALWQLLTTSARRLRLPSRDVGAGLVQAP